MLSLFKKLFKQIPRWLAIVFVVVFVVLYVSGIIVLICNMVSANEEKEQIDKIIEENQKPQMLLDLSKERYLEKIIVSFIDVGHGDCTFVTDGKTTMLIDAGSIKDGPLVTDYLKNSGVERIDYLIGTHPDEEHIGGLKDIIENFDVQKLIMPKTSILAITVCTTSVCAITVGEDVSFTADEYKDQSVGEKNETTRTEEQQQWDNANLNSVNRIDTIAQSWIETLDKQTVHEVYKAPDGYIFIQTGNTSIDIIKEIVDLQDDFVNGGKNYDVVHNTNSDDHELNDEQYGVLGGIAGQMGYDDVEDLTPSDSIDWGGPDILPSEDYDDFIFHIITSGGKIIRQEIAGDMFIIDYETYVKRLQGIETLLTYYSEQETIKTQYIVEIKAESVIEETVWTSKAKTWYDTGSTHYWEFDCLESSDGEYYSSMQKFSGPNITQSFNYPGKYKVTATQLLEQTFCDAMTYSINEYWVIAETGQIIWSHESTGSRIPNTSKDGLYSLGLNNIVNYHDRGKGTYYVTVYNEEIEIIDNSYDDILGTPGVWGYNFSTQRIG